MSASLVPFAFEGQPVRVVDMGGEPWMVATDVARILGYSEAKDLTRILDADEKGRQTVPTPGGEQEVSTISEPGLYRAIVQRRATDALPVEKREAIARFQRFVFHDVLPSIRRTGSYVAPAAPKPAIPKDVASAIRSFASIGRLIGQDRNQTAIAANQATLKTTGVDALALMGSTHLTAPEQERILTPTEIGKEVYAPARTITARETNLLIYDRGLQTLTPNGWAPTEAGERYAKFQDTGKRQGDGTPVRQLKWLSSILKILREAA